MQLFSIVKNTDLIFDLQNECIIHTNLLGCATTRRRGKTSLCLQEHTLLNTTPYHSIHLVLTSQRWCNVTSTFNLAYWSVGLEEKRKPELYMVFHDSSFVETVLLLSFGLHTVLFRTTYHQLSFQKLDKTAGNKQYLFCCRMFVKNTKQLPSGEPDKH